MSSYFGGPSGGGGGHGGHGGHGHGGGHHHHGGRGGIGFIVPAYVVESCDPALDPYCNPHAMVFGDDSSFCVGGSCIGGEEGMGALFNHVGNAAGIASLGKGALILGGLGALGYALAHHKVGAKTGVKL